MITLNLYEGVRRATEKTSPDSHGLVTFTIADIERVAAQLGRGMPPMNTINPLLTEIGAVFVPTQSRDTYRISKERAAGLPPYGVTRNAEGKLCASEALAASIR